MTEFITEEIEKPALPLPGLTGKNNDQYNNNFTKPLEKQEKSILPLTIENIRTACIATAEAELSAASGLNKTSKLSLTSSLKKPQGINGCELLSKQFSEPRWAVPGFIPQGLTLLSGKPKHGKSMFGGNIGIAVASGGKAFGLIDVDPGTVLYLALEDTQRRLQKRLRQMMACDNPNKITKLHLFTEWPRMDQSGLELLEEEIKKHGDVRLVIIDTLAKFRPVRKSNGNIYELDYQDIAAIKTLADKYEIAILVIHHLRKSSSEDIMDTISGSLGLTGAADGMIVLARQGGKSEAVLHITGRDVEQAEYALRFQSDILSWQLLGDVKEVKNTPERQLLFDCIKKYASEKALSPKEIADLSGLKENYIRKTLSKMVDDGDVRKLMYGKYIYNDSGNSGYNGNSGYTDHTGNTSPVVYGTVPDDLNGNSYREHFLYSDNEYLRTTVPSVPTVPDIPKKQVSGTLPFDANGKILLCRGGLS